jgi:hypothetical protein
VIQFKVLVKGPKKNPECLRIEMTSESDLFFHYSKVENVESFEDIKQSQKLNVEFDGFIGLLIKLLGCVHQGVDAHFAILTIQEDG